jgi:hypothetical protein
MRVTQSEFLVRYKTMDLTAPIYYNDKDVKIR